MYRALSISALLCLTTLAFAQTSLNTAAVATAPVQIVYVVDGSTLTTYNVNSQTLQPTQAGMTTMKQSVYPNIVTSPNGHIIYYTAFLDTSQQGQKLYVYNTNSSGVPASQPIQVVGAAGMSSPVVDPTNKFFYVVRHGTIGAQYTTYTIVRYLIDPATGKISQPVTEASYKLNSAVDALNCSLYLTGMNAAGTMLYDAIDCGYPHGGTDITYNERSVNTQTGALGPDQEIYSFNNNSGQDGQTVQFVKGFMFDFFTPNDMTNGNSVNVYWLKPNVKTPAISCTASMLADCGSFSYALAHPSAQYVFLVMPPSYVTDIAKVEMSSKKIVGTSSTIPYQVQQFSPDGKITYAANDVNTALNIHIYGFNVNTGQVAAGGLISVPSNLDFWYAAERR